ncbi:MAG: M20/M25/M40 family metallo-hydrolase [Cyclobacteriaceae bacterium]
MRVITLLMLVSSFSFAQPSVKASRDWIEKDGANILTELKDLISIPNHASDLPNIQRNAEKIKKLFADRGFNMQLLQEPGAPPIVYGEQKVKGATRTLCFYAHYDGQPVDPSLWKLDAFKAELYDKGMYQGGKPIPMPKAGEPINDDWRLYGRSASDDKAPIIAMMAAIDALKASKIGLTSNIKLFFDGEEESSSPHIETYMTKYGDLFKDISVWLLCDGAVYQTGDPSFKFGGRGITGMQLTVYGPSRPLHSGHYGNWAPVPGQMIARLLTSMKAEDGTVLIDGYYDSVEPISDFEKRQLANAPNIDKQMREELELGYTEGNGQSLNERLLLPSLTVRGLSSGSVGDKARNVIPTIAIAELGMRLVKGNDPEKMMDLVEAHIRKEGWHIVYDEPDHETRMKYPKVIKVVRDKDGFSAIKVNMDQPEIMSVINGVKSFTGDKAVFLPSSGGSNRVNNAIYDVLKTPAISVNMVNHDNNQHAENENVRVGNLWYGVDLMSVLMTLPNDISKK